MISRYPLPVYVYSTSKNSFTDRPCAVHVRSIRHRRYTHYPQCTRPQDACGNSCQIVASSHSPYNQSRPKLSLIPDRMSVTLMYHTWSVDTHCEFLPKRTHQQLCSARAASHHSACLSCFLYAPVPQYHGLSPALCLLPSCGRLSARYVKHSSLTKFCAITFPLPRRFRMC